MLFFIHSAIASHSPSDHVAPARADAICSSPRKPKPRLCTMTLGLCGQRAARTAGFTFISTDYTGYTSTLFHFPLQCTPYAMLLLTMFLLPLFRILVPASLPVRCPPVAGWGATPKRRRGPGHPRSPAVQQCSCFSPSKTCDGPHVPPENDGKDADQNSRCKRSRDCQR